MAELLECIGTGATSEVYLNTENRAVKLFRESFDNDAVDYESYLMTEINRLNIQAPHYYGIVKVYGRTGLIYEYAPGDSLLNRIISNPEDIRHLTIRMAEEHIILHKTETRLLPDETTRFIRQTGRVKEILGTHYERIITDIRNDSPESFLCHGDYHADNILIDNENCTVIDWMNSYSGSRAGDVARSCLMMLSPFIPDSIPVQMHENIMIMKETMCRIYLNEYLGKSNIDIEDIRKKFPVIAAVRLSDNVPGEREWLLRIIKEGLALPF